MSHYNAEQSKYNPRHAVGFRVLAAIAFLLTAHLSSNTAVGLIFAAYAALSFKSALKHSGVKL